MDPLEDFRKAIEASEKFGSYFRQQIEAFNKHFERLQEQFVQIGKSFEKLPDSMAQLADHGWYTTLVMTPGQTNYLANEIYKKHWRKVDNNMMELLQRDLNRIKRTLIERHPNRAKILRSAFKNHLRKDYNSSIPLFLTQADGICFESIKTKLYSTENKGVPKISKIIKELPPGSFSSLMLGPLLKQRLITATEIKRDDFSGTLNRHDIFHGISLDYGSKVNSFKSISWIQYISESLSKFFKKE